MSSGAQVGDDDIGGNQRCDADRHIDEEDPAPVDVSDDGAADCGSGQRGQACHSAPHAECRAAALGWKDRREDGQRLRRQQCPAHALQDSGGDQLAWALRDTTQSRRDREDEEADGEEVALPVQVTEATRRDQQHRVHEDVGVEDPEDLVERGVEPGAHGRNRHVNDGGVQQDHEKSCRQNQQYQPRISACLSHVSSSTLQGRAPFRCSTPAVRPRSRPRS